MDPKEGIPPHWMPYVSVPQLEEAMERIRARGGKVHAGPMEAEGVGRWAVVEDPQGGFVSPFETAPGMQDTPDEMMPPAGCFCWEELYTSDPAAAVRFYTGVFGWRAETMTLEPIGPYTMVYAGKDGLGGVLMQPQGSHPHWLSYVRIAALEESVRKAEALGGRVVVPPQNIPNIGRFAVVSDPVGATFALFHSVHG